ncbi:MAG: AAA family ATPase [Epsilonproteobacteria bacterium]|nr:AAA family ATPase [Campylobacterota bacterium]
MNIKKTILFSILCAVAFTGTTSVVGFERIPDSVWQVRLKTKEEFVKEYHLKVLELSKKQNRTDAEEVELASAKRMHEHYEDEVKQYKKIAASGMDDDLERDRRRAQNQDAADAFADKYFRTDNLLKTGALITMTGGGLFLLYHLSKFVNHYLETKLGKPKLVRETSMHSQSVWSMIAKTFGYEMAITPDKLYTFDNIIFPPNLFKTLKSFADMTKTKHEVDLPYQNLLLYGPPGTGKTLFAKTLAYYANVDYALVKGPDFFQFEEGQDILEFNNLMDWAEQSERGMIIFIDEADAVYGSRTAGNHRERRLVEAFLSRVEKGHKKFMFVFATNHPSSLDEAVLDRIHQKIPVALPGESERLRMLKLYIKQYLREDVRQILIEGKRQECGLNVSRKINDEFLQGIAQQLEGFSGRNINDLVDDVRSHAYATTHKSVTPELFSLVTKERIRQHQSKQNWETKPEYFDPDKLNELGITPEQAAEPTAAPAA